MQSNSQIIIQLNPKDPDQLPYRSFPLSNGPFTVPNLPFEIGGLTLEGTGRQESLSYHTFEGLYLVQVLMVAV